jgi:hypothetical protein
VEKQIAQARTTPRRQIRNQPWRHVAEQFIARREAYIEALTSRTPDRPRINRMETTQTWGFVAGVVAIAASHPSYRRRAGDCSAQ